MAAAPTKTAPKPTAAPPAKTRPAVTPAKAPAVQVAHKSGLVKVPQAIVATYDKDYVQLQKDIDALERSVGLMTTGLVQEGFVKNAIHTGVLNYDFVVGGGAAPACMTVIPGLSGSGKSTVVDNLAALCCFQDIPVFWYDAEAALDPSYVSRIFARYGLNLHDLMGRRDAKGNWEVYPRIRYSNDSGGERIFKMMAGVCDLLPKIKRGMDGHWYRQVLVKGQQPKWEEDPRQGKPQYLFIVDSWPALLPEARENNSDASPMASQARMISAYMNIIKSPIAMTNSVLYSVNQIRTRPGVTMGNPEYEPAGAALEFYADVRTQLRKVAPSTIKAGTGQYTEEPSWHGNGVDKYVYARIKNTKNKKFTPFRESTIRIAFERDGGPGDGICRTWDVMQFLLATGQAVARNGRLEINLMPSVAKGKAPPIPHGTLFTKPKFKHLVEAPQNKDGLYQHCLRQIRSGYAFEIERTAVRALITHDSKAETAAAADGFGDDDGLEA